MKSPLSELVKVPAISRSTRHVNEVVGAFESETFAVFQATKPANEHVILYVLGLMVIFTIGVSAVAKLDKVVTSTGKIVPAAGSLYVSPFDTGIVRQVTVKAGEIVKKGQSLATLDPTFTHADLMQLQEKLQSDQAAVAREEAELAGRPYVFSTSDRYQSVQGGIWLQRQAQYRSDLSSFDSQLHGAEAQIAQYDADVERYSNRLKLAGDTENVYKPLLDKGYVSKLQLMQATDARTEISRLLSDAEHQAAQYRQTMASLKSQRDSYIQKWHADVGSQLVTDRNDLELTRQNAEKAQKLNELTSLDAPEDAIVLRIGKVSTGTVTGGAGAGVGQDREPLFTLVPLDAPVEADINVPARDIGFIKAGDPVQLKLDAYRYLQHGTAKGVIKTISEGSFTTTDDNTLATEPYFKVRVGITEVKLRNVPTDFRLVPGMTLEGDILVGRRTILSYLLEGALRTGHEAMREP
jgi:HlyD family type I secretion membrane fusion protein